jgi:hypothetical protein
MAIIDKPTDYFNTVLWSGNATNRDITGVGFQPDFTWIKNRSAGYSHVLGNSLSGDNKFLGSNSTSAESTDSDKFRTFVSDGIQVGTHNGVNASGSNYVGWNWKAGGTASSNTDGSITSSVSANTTSGFSIVSYTGNGTAGATVGHGLGVTPDVIICKQTGGANDWMSYHSVLGNTKSMRLNATSASATATTYWNDTSPTSTVFSLGSDTKGNASSTMIAYCFAEKQGYSKFGSYTGNGNADGTFVYTGFKPAFVMNKKYGAGGADGWKMIDNKRNSYNVVNANVSAEKSDAEATDQVACDFLSNGFKWRSANGGENASTQEYIYMAFAENPFVTSTGVPATAR